MLNLGKVNPGSTVYIPFSSFAGSTGASITLSGLAVTDVEVYKDGGTTQRASDNGYTLLDTDGIDFDGITGIHGLSISLADNSTAGFWASGSRYFVVISSVTIDSQTVNFIAATFTIGYEGSVLDTTIATLSSQTSFTLTDGPAEDDALNGQWVIIHDVASAVQKGIALVLDYTGSTKTVTLAAATTFTAAATDNISFMGPAPLQPSTTGNKLDVSSGGEAGLDWSNIGSPTTVVGLSGTTVKTATDVETDTQDIQNRVPAALVGGRIDANMGAVSADALAADNLETMLDGTGGQELSLGKLTVVSSSGAAITATGQGTGAGIMATGGNTGGGGAGIQATGGNGSNAPGIRAAAGTVAGAGIRAIGAGGEPGLRLEGEGAGAGLSAQGGNTGPGIHAAGGATSGDGFRGTATAGDGMELVGAGGGVDLNADEVTAAAIRAALGLAAANLDSQLSTIDDFLDTEIAAIKAKTDNLPAAPAATGDIPTVSQIWTTALTEAYRSAGAAGTAAQLLHEILQNLTEFSISGTTKTVKKFDASTTAKTYTLNDATTPTAITETT